MTDAEAPQRRAVALAVGILHYQDPQAVLVLAQQVAAWSGLELELSVFDNSGEFAAGGRAASALPQRARVWSGEGNVGYAGAFNALMQDAAQRGAEYFLALTQDAKIDEASVLELLLALEEVESAAVAAPVLRYETDPTRIFSAGGLIDSDGRARHSLQGIRSTCVSSGRARYETAWVDGACYLARLTDLSAIGWLRSDYFLYCEDVDLGLSLLECGKKCVVVPSVFASQSPGDFRPYLRFRNQTALAARHPRLLPPWPWHRELAAQIVRGIVRKRDLHVYAALIGVYDGKRLRMGRPRRARLR